MNSCTKSNKIDVVIICESWVTVETKHLVNIPGYDYIGIERHSKRGGGVGFLVAKKLHYKHLADYDLMEPCIEQCMLNITVKGRNMICGSIYRPPNTDTKTFLQQFKGTMEKIKLGIHDDHIIGMDHNLDFLKSTHHSETSKFLDIILDNSMLPCITRPTRVTKNSSTLIDNIIVNNKLYSKQRSCVLLHDISDHFPSFTIIENVKPLKKMPSKIMSRSMNECSLTALKADLSAINWPAKLCSTDLNTVYDIFLDNLNELIEMHLPLREITISAKQQMLTKGLLKCGKTKLKLYERSLKSHDVTDIERYKQYRSMLQKITRRNKTDYYHSQCVKFRSDTRRLWRTINQITNKKIDKSCVIDYIKKDSIKIEEGSAITKEFGKYFSSIGKQVALKGGNSKKPVSNYLQKISINPNSVFLTPCTLLEINTLISQLPNKNSCGYDNISNVLLKKIGPLILEPLQFIFNMSLSTGQYPDQMKLADVIPLFKGGNQYLLNNYRPISLLPTISKLLEKNNV